jgi:hypothetical protein
MASSLVSSGSQIMAVSTDELAQCYKTFNERNLRFLY